MSDKPKAATAQTVCDRPGGLSLIVVLPPGPDLSSDPGVMHLVQAVRPHGILPFHPLPCPSDLSQVLRRPPADLGSDVTEYLRWRG
ncbi:MAG TPA: hypothetical protein VLA09_10855, partial [Longimicrobiales bacterium]|nr:hypothetical protein [Longimicrobiales bacterium]